MESLRKQATRILREQKKYKLWLTAFLCLAVLVTAGTVAALTMSGQALNRKEKVLTCQLEVHQHTEECKDSEGNLVCGQADYVVHVHNDDCYKDGELVCALPQVEPHTHTEECFQEQKTLVCELEESEGHVHDENCYTKVQGDLICGKEETGHQHGPECYTKVQGELICASEEEGHEHTDECYAWTEELTCGQTEEVHEHTDECYEWKEELTCQIAEGEGAHKHTDECCEIEMVNTCGQLELHTHEESCYEEDENGVKRLVCGQTELLEHVHGEDCFEIIEPDVAEESKEASEGAEETSEALESTEGTDESAEDTDETGEAVESTEGTDESAEDTDESTEADGEEEPVQGVAGVLAAEGSDYTVTATFGEDAGIPEGAELIVREVEPGTEEYETHYQQMLEAIGGAGSEAYADETDANQEVEEDAATQDEVEISFARLFDISFVADGEKIEPKAGASVDIRISYQDAMECGEGETASAVHFAKDGTEILEADVVESEEGSDFVFTQDSFSMTFSIKMIKAPSKKKTDTLTTKVGDVSVTVTDESADSFSTSDRVVVNEIKDNGEDIESGNNRYRKYLNNSKGAIKNKVNQEEEEVEVYSARVFEISIEESNGRKKQADNVKVAIQYSNGAKAEKSGNAAMILNSEDGGDLISSQSVAENQEIPVFTGMQTFSASAPNVVTTMMVSAVELADTPESGDGGNTTGHHDDVSGYLKSSAANDWQIVDKGYEGNTKTDKVSSTDGMVRVRKNVIPTDVENEFYVYLSIDMKEVTTSFLEVSNYLMTTPPNKGEIPGDIVESLGQEGSGKKVGTDSSIGNGKDSNIFRLMDGDKQIAEVKLYWESTGNATIYLKLEDGKYIYLAKEVFPSKQRPNGYDVPLSHDAVEALKKTISEKVSLGIVTDEMGDYIRFDSDFGIFGDYKKGSGISEDGTLIWIPSINENAQTESVTDGNKETVWTQNIAQLVYKVKLDVNKDGFNSCADKMKSREPDQFNEKGEVTKDVPESYPVNKSATLTYDNGKSVTFPVPQVRGLLYDHELTKKAQDKDGNDLGFLEGAEFTATGTDGDGKGRTYPAKSDDSGKVLFKDMPWGTYTIEETVVPEGYEKLNNSTLEVNLCYTKDMTLESDTTNDKPENMIHPGEKTEVINKKSPQIILKKEWIDDNDEAGKRPEKIGFKLTYQMDGTEVDSDIELTSSETPSENWTKTVTVPSTASDISCTEQNVPEGYEKKVPTAGNGDVVAGDAVVTTKDGKSVYTITNQYKKYLVEIKKIKKAADGTVEPLEGAVFSLYNEEPVDDTVEPIMTELKSGNDGIVYTGELGPGKYWLVETKEPTGYVKLEKPYQFEVKESEGTTAQEFEIENELAEQQVKILKVDAEETNEHLDGAVFSIKIKNGDSYVTYEDEKYGINGTLTSNDDGVLYEGKLPVGDYQLEETKAPDGYNLLEKPVEISIKSLEVKKDNADQPKEGETYIITILNNKGAILPETGGMGTKPYTIGGAILAVGSVFLMYGYSMRRKKSERRLKQ